MDGRQWSVVGVKFLRMSWAGSCGRKREFPKSHGGIIKYGANGNSPEIRKFLRALGQDWMNSIIRIILFYKDLWVSQKNLGIILKKNHILQMRRFLAIWASSA